MDPHGQQQSRPLRVLMVSQPTVSGVGVCVRNLAVAASRNGIEVSVASPAEGDLSGWLLEAGVPWIPLALERSPGFSDLRALWRLRTLVKDYDVVHLHSSKAGALGRMANALQFRGRRFQCVFTPHGWSWLVGGKMATVYRSLERWLSRYCDYVIAVSRDEAIEGAKVLYPGRVGEFRSAPDQELDPSGKSNLPGNLRVIANGVDTSKFTPIGEVAERTNDPLLVLVGQFYRPKGQDIAIKALSMIGDTKVRLRLVGTGQDEPSLRTLAEELGMAGRVEWTGQVSDTAPHLRAADIVLVPSRYDGLSLTLLEAMSCGRPIVASRSIGSSALGDAGRYVPLEDPRALAAAIEDLLQDEPARKRLGDLAREVAMERFDISRNVESNVALWQTLAARRRRP